MPLAVIAVSKPLRFVGSLCTHPAVPLRSLGGELGTRWGRGGWRIAPRQGESITWGHRSVPQGSRLAPAPWLGADTAHLPPARGHPLCAAVLEGQPQPCQKGSPPNPKQTMTFLLFTLCLPSFGTPAAEELSGAALQSGGQSARTLGSTSRALRVGKHKHPCHWDKQGSSISSVDCYCRLVTSGEMIPASNSAPCPAVTQHKSLSHMAAWEMAGLRRVLKQTCSHWLFSAFTMFVLRRE